ncbi:AraC family transcriptional regulator [Maricurvus nonylphenolicus]|uniref:AraC family transcriptional regulator n=1 Tax=Maricurvus nonylphenolicus TaxID=1008307 RepID=UPI0036F1E292
MVEARISTELKDIAARYAKLDGLNETGIPGLSIYKSSALSEKLHSIYEPCLCVTIQGKKDTIVEDDIFTCSEGNFLFSSMKLPVCGMVREASMESPYLSLVIMIEPTMVYDTLKDAPHLVSREPSISSGHSLSIGDVDGLMSDAVARLMRCLDHPGDIPVLAPMIIRELIYRLLATEEGGAIAQLGMLGSKTEKIARAVALLNQKFTEKLDMNRIAEDIGMSASNFYKHFKETTGMSPLVYQKKVRLLEARHQMLVTGDDAASVSYRVGYESPSQFSREYSNYFGRPPKKDIALMKSLELAG